MRRFIRPSTRPKIIAASHRTDGRNEVEIAVPRRMRSHLRLQRRLMAYDLRTNLHNELIVSMYVVDLIEAIFNCATATCWLAKIVAKM